MSKVTKTLNPLPFENLEPHRFEDLVRQLIYDFRNWRSLEPTGSMGSDDGYDARGLEIVVEQDVEEIERDDEGDLETGTPTITDRIWQIQCKREKTITPKRIKGHSDEMISKVGTPPYGVIFAAPCDFSKKTRDAFQAKMREKGVSEFYLWGRADLEDMLILPKNDHLLFAYFGISLIIQRRAIKTQIRSLLATKRKAVKHLGLIGQHSFKEVLVRDANDTIYPYSGNVPNFKKHPRWKKYFFVGHTHNGIKLLSCRFAAYRDFDDTTGKLLGWDYSEEVNLATVPQDYWNKDDEYDEKFRCVHAFLDKMEEKNRAFFEIEGIIPYERIIEIDPLGDHIAHCPHIFIEVRDNGFFEDTEAYIVPRGGYDHRYPMKIKDKKLRIKIFPKKFPKVPSLSSLPLVGSETKNNTK